ncbi:MAG: hypothetical protein IIA45_03405 [Bacteroidetes bacterium]|nr:hypothetical protein [Bacteroidota bacterium]
MAMTIKEALESGKQGFHIGRRLILPFKCQLIKIIVEREIYTELIGSKDVKINQDPQNTSIYFRAIGDLDKVIGSFEVIKLIVAEEGAELTDITTHIKLVCEIAEGHEVNIHVPSDDMLFIE